MILSLSDAKNKYGSVINGHWSDEVKWMKLLNIPVNIATAWINSINNKPTEHIYVNKDIELPLLKSLQNVYDRGLLQELKTFDGCFIIRDVRAIPGQLSCHAYGLAIDLNARDNKLGEQPTLSIELVKCWTDEGWSWGGNFKRKDGMHFSYAWE